MLKFDINEYKEKARETAVYMYPDYPLAALVEEVGEVMGKLAKFGRKNDLPLEMVMYCVSTPTSSLQQELREQVSKEMGDVIWQWVNLCHELNLNPAQVMADNIEKLQGRKERGTLEGSGDER
jgi:NTP pyrophosphatase (non-canonical NTP hydrolase)